MELRDLQYFEAIARHGNLGRAADTLGVGQPALSMSLRRLERSAQAKLVQRTPKGVELTAVGTALLAHARRLRLAHDDLSHEVAEFAQGRAGSLRIGSGPALAETFLPDAYGILLREAPNVSLTTTVSGTARLLAALRNGDLDLVVNHARHAAATDLVKLPLMDDEFVVYASSAHPLARRRSVTLSELAGKRWAVTGASVLNSAQSLTSAFEERGLPPPELQVVAESVMLRLRCVAQSGLLGFSSRRVVEMAAQYTGVRMIPVRDAKWIRPVALFHRREGYLAPALLRFIEILTVRHQAAK